MFYKYLLPFLIISFFLFNSCKNSDNPINSENIEFAFYGKVVGEHGKPIEGVNIHYIPELISEDLSNGSLNKTTPSTTINFSIPERSTVYFYILRYGTQDTLAVVVDGEELNSGSYSLNIDANKFTNGVYTYIIKYDTTSIEKNMLLIKSSNNELVSCDPLTRTDENGNFVITYKCLAMGLSFLRTGNSSPEPISKNIISNHLKFFMTKEGYQNYLEPITIDTTINTVKTFKLKR